MSNRYWNIKNGKPFGPAMCDLDNEKCLYPFGFCSICPKNDPTSTDEKAKFWNDAHKKLGTKGILELMSREVKR